jgi:hypothetical protein
VSSKVYKNEAGRVYTEEQFLRDHAVATSGITAFVIKAYGLEVIEAVDKAEDYPLTAVQFHIMIEEIGKAQAIRQIIAGMGNTTEARVASNKLERGTTFLRNDPLVADLAEAVGLTPEDVDTLWLQATGY